MLNSGDEEEISRLFFLTDFQVKVLADYVIKSGSIVSVYEIALLTGFDSSTARLMAPYVSLALPTSQGSHGGGYTSVIATAMARLPSGDPPETEVRSVLRLRHKGKKISYGLTAENDPGEPFTFNGAYGPDFLSGHIMYQGGGLSDRIIAGDYSLRFGEGLLFNSNAWQRSGLLSPSFMTGRTVVSPYVSTEENNFFRGVAGVLGNLTRGIVLFASSNSIDARQASGVSDSQVYITNLLKGGLHDTESGRSARNSLTENVAGMHISAGSNIIRGGITASFTHFSLPFLADSTDAKTHFNFRGDHLLNLGADLKAGTGRILFFSEAGCSFPGSWAVTGGIRATPSSRVTINLTGRYYSPDYYTFHASACRSGSATSNETGVSGNIHIEAARHLFLTMGADIYSIPWLRYRSSAPSTGSAFEFRSEYIPSENIILRLSYSAHDREYDIHRELPGVAATQREKREQLTAMFGYSPSGAVTITTRAGFCRLSGQEDKGYMLCQDLSVSVRPLPLKVWLRYALWSSDDYNTRLYAWENDMLYSFSIPAFYGEGSRAALMVSWKPSGSIELRAKYSVTVTKEEFAREMKREVRVQGRVVF
ncbi:MAG: hypothetical protein IH593_13905 [Bacteroidales bacterium]|nr:hypothetical protein [Bacteroidales bacterium]